MPMPAPVRAVDGDPLRPPAEVGSTVSAPVVPCTRLLALLTGRLGLMLMTSGRAARLATIVEGTMAESARTDV